MSKYYMSLKEINDIILKTIKDYNNLDSYMKSSNSITLKDMIITEIYTFYAPKFIANAEEIEQKDTLIAKLKQQLAIRDRALELTIKEIAKLNNNDVCANKQCADTNCDYYTETHNCSDMRKKYWIAQAEKELKGEK